MNSKQLHKVTELLANNLVGEDANIWPALKQSLLAGNEIKEKVNHGSAFRLRRIILASAISLLGLVIVSLVLQIRPIWQVLAQEGLEYFQYAPANSLPLEIPQVTPTASGKGSTPEPASILNASASIEEVASQAGYKLYQPLFIPDRYIFSGAAYDQESSTANLFYGLGSSSMYGYVLTQKPVDENESCKRCKVDSVYEQGQCGFCTLVGAKARVKAVSINGYHGEYVAGVWNLTDDGPVWESTAWVQRLCWVQNGIAFEISYFGLPTSMDRSLMVSIASSLQIDPLPGQSWTPTSQIPTPAPGDVLKAVDDVAVRAGYRVYQFGFLPEGFSFESATFDRELGITQLRYQKPVYGYGYKNNSYILKQQPVGLDGHCDLCSVVGPNGIKDVSVNGVEGSYLRGTFDGSGGNIEPPIQTLRWQQDGFAFELEYRGYPDQSTMDVMTTIASSIR
jgi:hypothetical protein